MCAGADRPLNLRVSSQRAGITDGDTPLGKQLANELKRHHFSSEGKAVLTGQPLLLLHTHTQSHHDDLNALPSPNL